VRIGGCIPPLSGQDNLHQLAGGDESRWSIKYPSELTKLIYGLPLQLEKGIKYTVYVLVFKDFKTFTASAAYLPNSPLPVSIIG
jgi:hypothetical protein